MRSFVGLVLLCFITTTASAEIYPRAGRGPVGRASGTLNCRSIFNITSQRNVLYKDSNVHGGRGRTFLDQRRQFGGSRYLSVAGTNKKIIGCFGLYRCDYPFGCRYYQAMCGDGASKSQFMTKARQNGGSLNVLVGNGSGKCFLLNSGASRAGSVVK